MTNIDVRIRDFEDNDYSRVIDLWKETGMGGKERADNLEVIQRCLKHGGKFLVMENASGTILLGTCWITFDGRRMHLHHFAITPEYQGMGLGDKLVEKSLEYLKKEGYQVKLEVHKKNIKAKNLYKKHGFFAFTDYDIFMIRDYEKL